MAFSYRNICTIQKKVVPLHAFSGHAYAYVRMRRERPRENNKH